MTEAQIISESKELAGYIELYKDQCGTLFEKMSGEVVREELCTGQKNLHRGFYCPSPVQDIVIGNCKRGRILKRKPTRRLPDYVYGFDKDNHLVVVTAVPETDCEAMKEVIIRQGNREIGFGFRYGWGIHWISVCTYKDEKILSYVFGEYSHYFKGLGSYHREDYTYSAEGLISVDMYHGLGVTSHTKYEFCHKDGYLSTYTVTEYDGENIKPSVWDGHVFEVYIKRKV